MTTLRHSPNNNFALPAAARSKRSLAIFENYHSYKRRKLSASSLLEMVDHINLDLDSFEIEDDDRTLPSYIYDVGM